MSSNQQTSNIEPMENEMESRENMKEIEEMLSPDVLKYIEQMTEETKQDQKYKRLLVKKEKIILLIDYWDQHKNPMHLKIVILKSVKVMFTVMECLQQKIFQKTLL